MNEGYTYRETIGPRADGQRIDAYLSARYRHSTLDQWRGHIEAGRVLIDGSRVNVDSLLALGQELAWHRPPWEEPEAPLALPVLYDEGSVLVVYKPAGLPTMAGGGFLQNTLVHQLRLLSPDASPAHRLGRWTSGGVLCSRTPEAGAHVAAQFSSRTIEKHYLALASGVSERETFEVNVPIGPVPYPPLGTLHAASPKGRASRSLVQVLEQRAEAFLCDVQIFTGRPHQIRIHLAAAGHPLVGDPLYEVGGVPAEGASALPGDRGYCLHAAEIGFVHPDTREAVRVVADAPPALRTLEVL